MRCAFFDQGDAEVLHTASSPAMEPAAPPRLCRRRSGAPSASNLRRGHVPAPTRGSEAEPGALLVSLRVILSAVADAERLVLSMRAAAPERARVAVALFTTRLKNRASTAAEQRKARALVDVRGHPRRRAQRCAALKARISVRMLPARRRVLACRLGSVLVSHPRNAHVPRFFFNTVHFRRRRTLLVARQTPSIRREPLTRAVRRTGARACAAFSLLFFWGVLVLRSCQGIASRLGWSPASRASS